MAINYKKTSSNPWADDEDDDWGFGARGRPGQAGRDPFAEEEIDERNLSPQERLQMQKQKSMNNTMASTQRALAGIYDAERTGIATAEELVRQGEQLDNIEAKTHVINQDMKQTQKSLNGIKSVFGSIKNWWGAKKPEPQEEFKPPPRESRLRDNLESTSRMESPDEHPALRMRSEDNQGMYSSQSAYSGARSPQGQSSMKEFDDQFDSQLSMMSAGLGRLKELGLGLESEVDAQNAQLGRIQTGVERADVTIQNQNSQIRGILGKKK